MCSRAGDLLDLLKSLLLYGKRKFWKALEKCRRDLGVITKCKTRCKGDLFWIS